MRGAPPRSRSVAALLRTALSLALMLVAPLGSGSVSAGPPIGESSDLLPGATQSLSAQSVRLSLDEAMGIFLKQNVDLLIAKFGIEFSKGRQITAGLFPNPVVSVGAVSSPFQGRTWSSGGQIVPQVQQLFELAGKRGFRIDSAQFGTQSAEAGFEDAVRQLSLAVKDAYYRTQLALRHLTLAEENRDRFSRILEINTIRFKRGYIAEVDLIRIRLQFIDFQSQVIQAIQEAESARSDLRQLLRLSPVTQLELTTDLNYKRVDPDIAKLRTVALDTRPDVRAKRLTFSQREVDLKLAKAYRVPDVTVGAGYAVQGSQGPDNSNQMALNLGLPLPLFNRNQGGIMQAEAEVQRAEADLIKTLNQVENQVDVAYRNLIQSRRLVEAFSLGGVLDDARATLTIVERAYERGGATLLDLLDAARTSRAIQQNYIEALFNYQRNVLQLESAVGQDITS
jgi:cobalt-zinc-cadmium efflux system outer membrane protein